MRAEILYVVYNLYSGGEGLKRWASLWMDLAGVYVKY